MAGLPAVAGTFLLATAFYAVSLHVAASYVLADPPARRALVVGPVPAAAVVGGQLLGVPRPAIAVVALVVDVAAVTIVYSVRARTAVLIALAQVVVVILLGFVALNLLSVV